jgi:hypothetical protein
MGNWTQEQNVNTIAAMAALALTLGVATEGEIWSVYVDSTPEVKTVEGENFAPETVAASNEVTAQSWESTGRVSEDDQGDYVVKHPTEPFVFTTGDCFLEVVPAVETPVGIFASPAGEVAPGADEWWSTDGPTTYARLDLPSGRDYWYDVVVIVNGHSQVSNLHGTLECDDDQ